MAVMESAHHRHGDEFALTRRRLRHRRFSGKPLMRSRGVVVVLDELSQEPLQVSLVEHDHVVQQLPPEGPDELTVSRPPDRKAIQLGRQSALDRHELSRRHRSRQEQRPGETESIPEEMEEDAKATAEVPEETRNRLHVPRIPGDPQRNKALGSPG